jgi:hypothetical protein
MKLIIFITLVTQARNWNLPEIVKPSLCPNILFKFRLTESTSRVLLQKQPNVLVESRSYSGGVGFKYRPGD